MPFLIALGRLGMTLKQFVDKARICELAGVPRPMGINVDLEQLRAYLNTPGQEPRRGR